MSDAKKDTGLIAWTDLTVADADGVRVFYEAVAGWTSEAVEMDGYADFNMKSPAGNQAVAGICHARGVNAELPPQWLIYITVADLPRSLSECESRGGRVLHRRESSDGLQFAVIQDPAGAVAALFPEKG